MTLLLATQGGSDDVSQLLPIVSLVIAGVSLGVSILSLFFVRWYTGPVIKVSGDTVPLPFQAFREQPERRAEVCRFLTITVTNNGRIPMTVRKIRLDLPGQKTYTKGNGPDLPFVLEPLHQESWVFDTQVLSRRSEQPDAEIRVRPVAILGNGRRKKGKYLRFRPQSERTQAGTSSAPAALGNQEGVVIEAPPATGDLSEFYQSPKPIRWWVRLWRWLSPRG